MAEALPHFLPFRLAYEVAANFPLSDLQLRRTDPNNYILRFEVTRNHPIYKPTGMSVRIDMTHIERSYPCAELCVIDLLEALIALMTDRIRPKVSEMMLREYAPWMFLPNGSLQHPETPPSADTTRPESTLE